MQDFADKFFRFKILSGSSADRGLQVADSKELRDLIRIFFIRIYGQRQGLKEKVCNYFLRRETANSSTSASTSSSLSFVESMTTASLAATSGDAARVRSRRSRSRRSAASLAAPSPFFFCCCPRRGSRPTRGASGKSLMGASG